MKRFCMLLTLGLLLPALPSLASDFPRKVEGGVLFTYRDDGASNVAWAGDFNGWNTNASLFENDGEGVFTLVLPLGPGEHQYKFVVDGNWITDPSNTQTGGDYGNSMIKVDGQGEVVEAGGGPQPSPLNSKLFVDGFYYAQLRAEAFESENDRVLIEKPTHNLNMAFDVELNPSLAGRVELSADNIANPSEMWRTALNFQRARLVLTRPAFTFTLFDNEASFQSDEAASLVGEVGTYEYDYGYNARGGILRAPLPFGFDLTAMVADASVANPWRPGDPDRGVAEGEELEDLINYNRNEDDGFRDDWVVQLSHDLGPGRALYLGHATRGLTPGNLWFQDWQAGGATADYYYYRTVQNNLLHALSYRFEFGESSLEIEGVLGDSKIQAKDRQWEFRDGEEFNWNEQAEVSWKVQDTRGLVFAARTALPFGLHLTAKHSFQENRNILVESGEELSARALHYGGDLTWNSKRMDYTLDLEQSEYYYDEGLGWGDQFIFAAGEVGYGNSWITGDKLPLDAYTTLGYGSTSRLRQRLAMLLDEGEAGDMMLNLSHTVASTRLDRSPLYWEVIVEIDWRFHKEWSVLLNQRMARYDQDFLDISHGYASSFLELSYHLNKRSYLALGWGVDPYWLDGLSKRILPHGRREFLADNGLNDTAMKESYLGLGRVVDRAETALSQARLLTLEARFDF